jgi:hypothetical protein
MMRRALVFFLLLAAAPRFEGLFRPVRGRMSCCPAGKTMSCCPAEPGCNLRACPAPQRETMTGFAPRLPELLAGQVFLAPYSIFQPGSADLADTRAPDISDPPPRA